MGDARELECRVRVQDEDLGDEELGERVKAAIEEREDAIREYADANGIEFLGARAVRKMSRYALARGREERFGIVPTLACKDPELRATLLRERRAWLEAYVDAVTRWRAGDREVVFPRGTYKMRVHHEVNVAPPPT